MFLAVTGAETLYADMGHFGRKAIGFSWLTLVYPCLMLNYLGQGALLLGHPGAATNPFYLMAPEWARLPLVGIATAATIIASQAVISGAFSVTHQAVQLGFLPRLRTEHTSEKAARPDLHSGRQLGAAGDGHAARPRIPRVEPARLGLRHRGDRHDADHHRDARRAGFQVWRWNRLLAAAVDRTFLLVDGAYFASNITKIPDGGWFPLLVAAVSFTVLTTWAKGRQLMRERLAGIGAAAAGVHQVGREFGAPGARNVGVPVGLGRHRPAALLHNLKHNQVLHERVIILNVKVEDVPHVAAEKRRRGPRCRAGLLSRDPALRVHGRGRHPARPRRDQDLRRAVQHDEHQLLPRPAETDRIARRRRAWRCGASSCSRG